MLRRKACWFIIDRRRRKTALCSYKRFNTCLYDYIVEENIFGVIVYKHLEQQKNWNIITKIPSKLMVNKGLKYQKRWIC